MRRAKIAIAARSRLRVRGLIIAASRLLVPRVTPDWLQSANRRAMSRRMPHAKLAIRARIHSLVHGWITAGSLLRAPRAIPDQVRSASRRGML
jgi:hypothetical protein